MRIAVVTVSVSFITSGSFPYKRSKKNVDGGKAIPSSGRNRHYNFKQFFSHYINLPKFILIYLNLYYFFRANAVQKSLQGLRDHLRSSSSGAANVASPSAPTTCVRLTAILASIPTNHFPFSFSCF